MLVIRNIGELVLVPRGPVGGRSMGAVDRLTSAALLVRDGQITWLGSDANCEIPAGSEVIDAGGNCVIPGLNDCHSHTVFTGTREAEFVQRINGRSYAEIAESGGGIRTTVEAVRKATQDELTAEALPRLERILAHGVTTLEVKSGYGLTVDDELKMLRTIAALDERQAIELIGTFLGAHTTPREFSDDPDGYLDLILSEELLSTIRNEKLAEFCDVFCERTAFDVERSRRVLTTAARFGLSAKLHADQITQIGATRLAGELKAVSADHLETIDDAGIASLKAGGCIAVLLPSCSWFLGVEQAPARRLIEADLPVAVGTDYNPGSSMVESLPLTMAIACTQMRMTPTEVLIACTANAAAALRRENSIGSITVGMQADLCILDVPHLERMMYEPGRSCMSTVIKKGKIVYRAHD